MSCLTFTPTEDATLVDLILSGESWAEIARQIPTRSPWAIKHYARTRGHVVTVKGQWPVVADDEDFDVGDATAALLASLREHHAFGVGELTLKAGPAQRISVPLTRSMTSSFGAMAAEGGVA